MNLVSLPDQKGVPGTQGWAESLPFSTRAWPGDEHGKCQFLSSPARERSQTRPRWPWLLLQAHSYSLWPVVGRAAFAWLPSSLDLLHAGLTGTGAEPADPCRLRPLLPAVPICTTQLCPRVASCSLDHRKKAPGPRIKTPGPPPTTSSHPFNPCHSTSLNISAFHGKFYQGKKGGLLCLQCLKTT